MACHGWRSAAGRFCAVAEIEPRLAFCVSRQSAIVQADLWSSGKIGSGCLDIGNGGAIHMTMLCKGIPALLIAAGLFVGAMPPDGAKAMGTVDAAQTVPGQAKSLLPPRDNIFRLVQGGNNTVALPGGCLKGYVRLCSAEGGCGPCKPKFTPKNKMNPPLVIKRIPQRMTGCGPKKNEPC